jgi:hypothetical protein
MHCLVIYLYEAAPNVSACRAAAIGRFLPLASGGFESVSADRDRQKSAISGHSVSKLSVIGAAVNPEAS